MWGIVAALWTALAWWCLRTTSRRSRQGCARHLPPPTASICQHDNASWKILPSRTSSIEPNKRCSVGLPTNPRKLCGREFLFISYERIFVATRSQESDGGGIVFERTYWLESQFLHIAHGFCRRNGFVG